MDTIASQGESVPKLGLGTWSMRGRSCREAIRQALEIGYRHIDTAEIYGNEAEVGDAIADSRVEREKIFLTTKVWKSQLHSEQVKEACDQSLRKLGMDYIDLYLIHAPNPSVSLNETLEAMNALRDSGKIHHIGVSNFSVSQLKEAQQISNAPIFTNQVKFHPFHGQSQLVAYCQEENVLVTAYTPLARGRVMRESTLKKIGQRYGKTPAQVALRWLIQQDHVITIPKASSSHHQQENMDIFDFELTSQEMDEIRQLTR